MRETMLPPQPSTRIAAWARLNAIWFGVVDVVGRQLGVAVRVIRRGAELVGPGEVPLHLSSLGVVVPRRATRPTRATSWSRPSPRGAPHEERATSVEVRRPQRA